MNRHERRAYTAQNRRRVSAWHASAWGETHIEGGYDEAVKRAGGEDNVTTVTAKLGDATLKAAVPIADIEETLSLGDEIADKHGKDVDVRQSAMTFVIDAMKKGQHLNKEAGGSVVQALLWLACRRPGHEEEVMGRAKAGGHIISWVITEGGPGFGNNWRLILDGLPEDADGLPTPRHPKLSKLRWTSGKD